MESLHDVYALGTLPPEYSAQTLQRREASRMKRNRIALAPAGAALLLSALLAGCTSPSTGDDAATTEKVKVKIAYGNPAMMLTTPDAYLPLELGWWADEGYDVEIIPAGGSAAAIQLVVGGEADVAIANTSPALSANALGAADIRSVSPSIMTAWRIAVPADSGIRGPEDLAGKTIGLATSAAGGAAYLDAYLNSADMTEDDVEQVVVGFGPSAYQALSSGQVDAILTFTPEIYQFETLGGEFRLLFDEEWLEFPDYGLLATNDIIEANPDMIVALARGVAKSMIFMTESPECTAKIYVKHYGSDKSAAAVTNVEYVIERSVEERERMKTADGYWGVPHPDGLLAMQKFLHERGLIESGLDLDQMVPAIDDFAQKVNDFSQEDVLDAAASCEI